ncbi:hypothetical protein N2152v2_009737 [Parachlorella kessleri]
MARSKSTPVRHTPGPPRSLCPNAARKSAPAPVVSFITVWNRAAVAAVRDCNLGALQQFAEDSAAGRPGPLTRVEASIVVDRTCAWVSLLGLAIVLEAEAAALWLVQNAKAEADAAAEAATTSDEEAAADAALCGDDGLDSESSFGGACSDEEPNSDCDEGWLHSRAHVLLPHPEEVPDGNGWPHYPLSAAEALRYRNKVWLGTLDGERITPLELAVHQGMWRVVGALLCAGVPVPQNPYLLPQAEQALVKCSRKHRNVWSLLEGRLGLAKRNRSHGFHVAIRGVALLERRDGERITPLELAVHQGMWRVVEALLGAGVPVPQNPYLLPQAEQAVVKYSRHHRHVWLLLEGHLGLAKRHRSHGFHVAIRGVALLERRVTGMTRDISRIMARMLRCTCGFCLRKRPQCPVCLEEGAAY